jgi:thiamine biosynthesis lipoprotein
LICIKEQQLRIMHKATQWRSNRYLSVTVMAPSATHADALSTALSLMPLERCEAVLKELGAAAAWFVLGDGEIVVRRT